MVLILLGTTSSKAALQSNPTTHRTPVNKYGEQWLTQIRQMETTGQTMGLDETLNGVEATSEENGIDVHMMLPTEYVAVAILSTSGYGNPGKLQDETDVQKRTTTGNSTGVYFTGDRWELTAGLSSGTSNKYLMRGTSCNEVFSMISGWHGGSAIKIPGFADHYGNAEYNGYSYDVLSLGNGSLFSKGWIVGCNDNWGNFGNSWTGQTTSSHGWSYHNIGASNTSRRSGSSMRGLRQPGFK